MMATASGRHVRLARSGHDYIGLCPFHEEATPPHLRSKRKKGIDPIRLTQVRRLMGCALWAAEPTPDWGHRPQEAGGVRGATPLGEAESLS